MSIKIAIIDYELGNLFSVEQALSTLGINPLITHNPEDLATVDAAILPGVGAFRIAMDNLKQKGLDYAIHEFVKSGKPLMGVCLGLQLLFERSNEFEDSLGLGLVGGQVNKLPHDLAKNIKVPQIGWNTINQKKVSWKDTPLKSTSNGDFMYFVHSYYVSPSNTDEILTYTTYHDFDYCSSIIKDNIFATQFHPEKSGKKGLNIYKNWIKNI